MNEFTNRLLREDGRAGARGSDRRARRRATPARGWACLRRWHRRHHRRRPPRVPGHRRSPRTAGRGRAARPCVASRWGPAWASVAAAWCTCVSSGSRPRTCRRCRRAWRRPGCRWRCSAAAMSAGRWSACWRRCRSPSPGSTAATTSSRPICRRNRALRAFRSGAGRGAGPGAPGSRVLIMSFSHAEDLDVVLACLKRQRERDDLRLHRPDRQQDQMGDVPPSAGGSAASPTANWPRSPARSACPASPARSRR